MKKNIFLLITTLLISSSVYSFSKEKNGYSYIDAYFPVRAKLTFQSSFGQTVTEYIRFGKDILVINNEGEKFKYKQTMLVKDDGIYVTETYQYLKLFLFFKKEATYTYSKPLLRLPNPLIPGTEWKSECDEYCNGDTGKVKLTGKVGEKEIVKLKSGSYEAVKVESLIEGSSGVKNQITEWYAEGIGLIKANIKIGGGGFPGLLRDALGYGDIDFELDNIKRE
ncbi:MAG: hypothetical protein M1495_11575 [Bacteroidetes bacterium]|nr:hypothetical protein [Bacteroidota bacterium]